MRPQVTVNAAASIDGKLALSTRTQTRLSSDADMARARRLRGDVDAVLVGVGTVLADDPGLMAPAGSARQPLRVVVDSRGRTPRHARVLDGKAPTLVATTEGCNATFENAKVLRVGRSRVDLAALLEHLAQVGVKSVLVEGGGEILHSFLSAGLVDDLYLFLADIVLGGRNAPTVADGEGAKTLAEAPRARFVSADRLEGGLLLHYRFGAPS